MSKVSTKRPQRKRSLEERVFTKARSDEDIGYSAFYFPFDVKRIVRAELGRLARQVRKKKVPSATVYSEEWYYNAGIDDAIELIREAKG
jgi:hypothetical protein